MSLMDQINGDIKMAMKEKKKEKLNALRYLKSLFIENKTSTKPIEESIVAINHAKKLTDSIELYPQGDEQREKLKTEIAFLKDYLPQKMEKAEVEIIIKNIVAGGASNMGMIMKELAPQIKGRFDGKEATNLVKAALL